MDRTFRRFHSLSTRPLLLGGMLLASVIAFMPTTSMAAPVGASQDTSSKDPAPTGRPTGTAEL